MKRHFTILGILAVSLFAGAPAMGDGVFEAGRYVPEERSFSLSGTLGQILEMEGMVQETTRSFYDATDQQFKQDLRENFSLDDFNMEGGIPTVGLSLQKVWQYFTFQLDASVMNPETDAVARRNYYIGVGEEVEFQGGSYKNIKIPEGSRFSMEMISAVTELRGLITPFTFMPIEGVKFTPWIDLGLFLFGGWYEIDAGEPSGVSQYLNPPEDFVVGGRSEGVVGLGLPEWGLGGEVRLGGEEEINLVLQGHYAVCRYEGGTGFLTSSSHREKDIDLDHVNYKARVTVEFPAQSGRCLVIGAQYQLVESEASITSTAETEAEIIARRERFDKDVNFRMSLASGIVGFTF